MTIMCSEGISGLFHGTRRLCMYVCMWWGITVVAATQLVVTVLLQEVPGEVCERGWVFHYDITRYATNYNTDQKTEKATDVCLPHPCRGHHLS